MVFIITGEVKTFKSTLVQKLIKGRQSIGMLTFPIMENNRRIAVGISDLKGQMSGIAAICSCSKRPIPNTHVFDTIGVQILQKASQSNASIIVLDELGFLENDALLFKKAVLTLLDSGKTILAVVKPLQTPFLNNVRSRADRICELNRSQKITEQKMKEKLKEWRKYL